MTRGPDLSVGQRLGMGLALLLAVLAGLVAAGYYWNERSAVVERAFTQRIAPLSEASDALERGVLQVAITVRAYLLAPNAERLQAFDARVDAVRTGLRRMDGLPKEPDGEARFREVAPRVERYLREASDLVGQRGTASEASLARTRESLVTALQDFSDLQQAKSRDALREIQDARETGTRSLLAVVLLALLTFVALAALMVRAIRGPTRELVDIASSLGRGDWRPALAWAPAKDEGGPAGMPVVRDEMRQLARAFGAAAAALETREQRLRADREIAGASASSLSKADVADAALRTVCDHVSAEVGVLYWADETSRLLVPVAQRALDGELVAIAPGEGIPGRAAREGRTVLTRDIPADSPFSVRLGYDRAPPRCVAAVPIAFRGELLGVLLVASLHELDEAAVGFLEDAARQLAIGLQNVKTYERVQQLLHELGEKNQHIQAQNEELQSQNEELQAQSEEIQAQNEELQAQGEEITAQNDQLKQQAESLRAHAGSLAEADRRKSEFLGVLAHELRNPMAAISNSLFALTKASDSPAQRDRAEEVIRRQTRLLGRLVDDLLDVTRISSGKVRLQKEQVDFAAVVRECADDYRDAAAKSGVRIEVATPQAAVLVEGDRTRLCQIVGNLVDNAIKFVNGGREVRVSLTADAGQARLSVRDRGIGMDATMLERLFQPFSQADSSLARRRSGLGLGLALAKALVDMHAGTIEARSDGPGQGAEFIVRLPLSVDGTAASSASPKQQRAVLSGQGRRILIIEDNPDAALSLRDAMEIAGHEVRVAYDAAEGIEVAREFRPEVLLCDIGLPSMDGYQVARRFRSDERLRSTYMIAVTGYAGPDDRVRAFDAGFDRHVGKPPDIELLNQLLAEVNRAG